LEFLGIFEIRIILAVSMLFIASFFDLWKREVHDVLWIIFGSAAIILIFFETDYFQYLTEIGFAMIVAPFVLLFWRIGLFGGADALCLIVLAALAPQFTFTDNIITPFTTLTNAAVLSIIYIISNVIRNLISILNHKNIFEGIDESKFRKVCAMFVGHRSKNPKHSFSMEDVRGNTKKLKFSIPHAENTEFCKSKDTWVMTGIPYIFYFTPGFIIQLFFGDIVMNFLSKIIMN